MFDQLMFQQKIQDHVKDIEPPREFEFRASSAGECPKLMDHMMQEGVTPPDYYQSMRMMMGTYMHEMWQKIMVDMLGDDFIGVEEEMRIPFEVQGEPHFIIGHPDGVIKSLDAVYELKTVGESTFKMIQSQDKPLDSHYKQAQIYGYGVGTKNILFQYFNRNNGESLWFFMPTIPDVAEEIVGIFAERVMNNFAEKIAERPYHDPTGSPCWFCPKVTDCYKDFKQEVEGGGSFTYAEDSDVGVAARTANESRTTRLAADKSEKAAKKVLSDILIAHGVNMACVVSKPELNITVKVGKNNNPLIEVKESK